MVQRIAPTIGPTRTEDDFTAHIQRTVSEHPDDEWIFIVDNLNTHVSASLVEWLADTLNISDNLGKKGNSGILRSMKTRKAFLSDESHRIRFVYTPKHASWLNQVEIWFSTLARRLLRYGSFKSIDHLRQRIMKYINYHNASLAKPYQWTHTGQPLQA